MTEQTMEAMEVEAPPKTRRMAFVLPFIIVVLVGVITAASGIALYRAKLPAILEITGKGVGNNPNESVHVRGRVDAPVTIEEFGDFQCPPCGTLSGPIKQLEEDHKQNLRVIFHHFPLITHNHAREAACAAEAAGLQSKFWEMHDILYREQREWSKAAEARPLFNAYANLIGLDMERFKQDIDSEKVKERVSADQARGTSLGVENTPTIFLNNRAVEPANLNPEKLRGAVEEAIKAKTTP